MKTTLIACTLNEIEAVQIVLPQIKTDWVDEILIVDGGSTDGTVEWCRANGYKVLAQAGRGYGAGIRQAVDVAAGDVIIEFPPDGNSMASKIQPLLAKVTEGYDLVIVSRYREGARSLDDDFMTGIGNWMFTRLTNLIYGTSYTDVLVGFRAYRKDAFKTLQLDEDGLSFPYQEVIRFARKGYRITEIPGDEPPRIGGQRKMRILGTGLEILGVMIRERFTNDYLTA